MAKGQKYYRLTEYFKNSGSDKIEMTFIDLERIMKEKIPSSIFKYKTFGSRFDHSFSYGWSLAGYSAKADFYNNIVTFLKVDTPIPVTFKVEVKKSINSSTSIKVLNFFNKINHDEHDRYKSWEHCYGFFTNNRKNNTPVSLFSLHLFTYLASWGMLRGSAFLLQKDYLFHNEVVEELLNEKYDCLVGINPANLDNKKISLIFELSNKIREIYYDKTYYLKGIPNSNTYPSDTLLTKILMGTLGCVPAYDRYFIDGMKQSNLSNRKFSPKSIKTLQKFYTDNKVEFDSNQEHINKLSLIKYPVMKLIDMHFWQIGYERDSIIDS
jgi:hypothetical protein